MMGKVWPLFRRGRPPERSAPSDVQAVTLATLAALKESSDAFPPLKSAVAGVLHIVDLCQRVKSNQEACRALASRVQEILYMIADAVPDATQIPPDILVSIDDFTRTLRDVQVFMESLLRRKRLARLVRHKEDEGRLIEFKERLDEAFRSFALVLSIKNTMMIARIVEHGEVQGVRLDDLNNSVKHGQERTLARLDLLVVLFI